MHMNLHHNIGPHRHYVSLVKFTSVSSNLLSILLSLVLKDFLDGTYKEDRLDRSWLRWQLYVRRSKEEQEQQQKTKRQSQLKTEKQNKNLLKVKTTAENEERVQKARVCFASEGVNIYCICCEICCFCSNTSSNNLACSLSLFSSLSVSLDLKWLALHLSSLHPCFTPSGKVLGWSLWLYVCEEAIIAAVCSYYLLNLWVTYKNWLWIDLFGSLIWFIYLYI